MEGVGHPRIIELIEISEDDDGDTEVHIDVNREGVGHPIGTNDDEDEFNDMEEITDKNMDNDEEINLIVEPEIPEESETPEEHEIPEIQTPEKKKQLSQRDRRRTRSMAVAAKRKTPRKERWIL